jgi:hypothetical protein
LFKPPRSRDHLGKVPLQKATSRKQVVPFTYNPLHDLESIWWVATFFLFHHFPTGGHDRHLLDIDVDKLFPTSDQSSRMLAFTLDDLFEEMVGHLPIDLQMHGNALEICRQILLRAYRSAESTAASDISKAAFDPQVHNKLRDIFRQLHDDSGSLAASAKELKTQSLVGEHDEVDKSFKGVECSPSTKQTSIGNAMLRRSTRLRKVVHEQQIAPDDTEHFEHTEPSHSPRKRKRVND